MSTAKIKKKEFTKKRKTNKYIIKKRKTNKYIIKKRITKYKNQYTTKQSHKNKKRKNMKKYAYNMKGGGAIKHVFIRPYYPEHDSHIFSAPPEDIYYYGDFKEVNIATVKEIEINIPLLKDTARDNTDILKTYTKENIEKFTKEFPSSNSRPEFNKVRNLYKDATGKLTSEQVLEYFEAIARDIKVIADSKTMFASSILLKAPPRENRCTIKIVKEGNTQQWIFKIVDGDDKVRATYYLNSNFTDIFDEIFELKKISESRFFDRGTRQYTTYGSDLWFIYVKFIRNFLTSITTDIHVTTEENYLECIKGAFDLMTKTNEDIVELPSAAQDTIYLYNDSLDNDIDDILAIICLEYLYQQKNITGSLNYKEGQQFRWVDNTHTEYEKTKVILSKLHTKIKEIIAKKEPLLIDPDTMIEPIFYGFK